MQKDLTVLIFGAFDGIHAGHLYYLRESKKLGTKLIVSIARDHSNWKFTPKYNLPENERADLIKELKIADQVILGSKTDALDKIKEIKPDIIAITPYQPIDKALLEKDLISMGLKTKVVLLKPYKPEIYAPLFRPKNPLTKESALGLSPICASIKLERELPFEAEISRALISKSADLILFMECMSERSVKLNVAIAKIFLRHSYSPLLISTTRSATVLFEPFLEFGVTLENIFVIDFATSEKKPNSHSSSDKCITMRSFSDLSGLLISIESHLKQFPNSAIIFDSLSLLYANNTQAQILNFLVNLTSLCREMKMPLVIVAPESSLAPDFRSQLIPLCDRAVKIGY